MWIIALNIFQYGDKLQIKDIYKAWFIRLKYMFELFIDY